MELTKKLQLIQEIIPGYTINTYNCTMTRHNSYLTAIWRAFYGDNRELVYKYIDVTIEDAVSAIAPDNEVFELLKKCPEGITNLKKTYEGDEDMKLRLDTCLEKIKLIVQKFEPALVKMSEQIKVERENINKEFLRLSENCEKAINEKKALVGEEKPEAAPAKDPNALPGDFNWVAYLINNREVARKRCTKLYAEQHYLNEGRKKNLSYDEKVKFNWKSYVSRYPDLKGISTEEKALQHYLVQGRRNGRDAS